VWQHTPSTQKVDSHSVPSLQTAPSFFFPQWPVESHRLPAEHCVLSVQDELQSLPLALQVYGAHMRLLPASQRPAPSQVESAVRVPLLQLAAAQVVPAAYLWQTPAPSQVPSVPQVERACTVQVPEGSEPPAATAVHVPLRPVSEQDMQVPVQAVLQHTPWAQNRPEAQSVAFAQMAPTGEPPHEPLRQATPPLQSAAVTHELPQAEPAQR
jgi:hypothetical protein